MKSGLPIRICLCIALSVFFLFLYLSMQNEITAYRLKIPQLEDELAAIEQENVRLEFEIAQFMNPTRLLKESGRPEFCHLKFPYKEDIVTLPKGYQGEWP